MGHREVQSSLIFNINPSLKKNDNRQCLMMMIGQETSLIKQLETTTKMRKQTCGTRVIYTKAAIKNFLIWIFFFFLFLLVNICWLVMRVVGSVVVLFWHLYTRRSSFQTKSAAILNEMRRVKVNVYTSYVLAYDTIMRKEIWKKKKEKSKRTKTGLKFFKFMEMRNYGAEILGFCLVRLCFTLKRIREVCYTAPPYSMGRRDIGTIYANEPTNSCDHLPLSREL